MRQLMYPNPFSGVKTKTNFALNLDRQKEIQLLANANEAIEKKKKTFKEINHQQKEKNSQFGTVWCVEEAAVNLANRKKFKEIPAGWITTTEWKDRRKNKKSNAYGRHWYNNGEQNFYLMPDDAKITILGLKRGRLKTA